MKFSDSHPFKRCFVFFLALILAIPTITVPIVAHAASFSDLSGHWATSYINTAVSKGIAGGYTDGTFRPDNSVTRAEFAAMINRAFGNTGSTSISFLDVPASEWYYNEVAKGMSAAFVGGYDDNTFRPDNPISRQEAAVMISRVIPTYGSSANLKTYSDNSSISDWATYAMSKICGKGYMGAYKDGKLHPLDNLTRAQTAKILCDIVASETMVSGTTTVRTNGTTLSNRIYTNDVVLHSDLGSGEASLSNCIVLGTLYVYGGGENTITVKNSRVANAVVEKSSSGVRLLAQGESVIANTSASKTSILETSGLSGNLYGTGFNLVNVKSSADTTLKGSFVKVNVVGSSAKMNLKSGTISTLDVESSGRNSDITVASGATVTTTNVNGAAAFHGSGTINTMNANTSGITYETKPRYVKTSNSSYDPNTSMNTGDNRISINPKNGATGVAVDDTITLTFDSATTRYSGTALTTSNIDDYIKLRRNSSSGTEVSYSASISSTKKVITISPSKNLEEDTKYYVTIDRNALMIGNTGNSSFSSYFTTDPKGNGSSTMDGITISPKKGATKVNVDSKITLTFDRAVTRYNGNALTNSNIEDYIELRKSKSSGTRIDFDASINSTKKTITLTPKRTLTEDTKYYVSIEKNLLKFGGNGNSEFYSYFTTGDSTSGITFYPKNDATGISTKIKPTIAFSSAIETYSGKSITRSYLDSSVINFREGSSGGSRVSFSASINSSKKEITIEPDSALKDGQKYYLAIENKTLRTQSDEKNIPSTSVTWTVGSSAPTVSFVPSNGLTSVSLTSNVYLYFSQSVYDTSGATPSSNYIISNITIRDNTTGSNVSYNLSAFSNNSGGAVMTLDPISDFISGHNYTVYIPSSKFRNSSSTYLSAASANFSVLGSIDTSVINTAINNANAAKTGVQTSSNGSDIATNLYWVTQAQLNTLNNAISVATNAKATVTTLAQAQTAATTLNSAVITFNAAKKVGTKVNTSVIDTAISSANSTLSGVQISSNGADLYPESIWVTKAQMDALNSAISVAKNAKSTVTTLAQAQATASTLNSAVSTFNGSKKAGTKAHVDTSLISTALTEATSALSNTSVSSDGFDVSQTSYWVTQDAMNTFNAAINTAKSALNTVENESQAFNVALALKNATTTFKGKKQSGNLADKSSLSAEIKSAQSNLINTTLSADGTDISSSEKWVSQSVQDAYTGAISAASAINSNSTVTQEAVNSGLVALKSATATFNSAKQNGTKE